MDNETGEETPREVMMGSRDNGLTEIDGFDLDRLISVENLTKKFGRDLGIFTIVFVFRNISRFGKF